MKRVTGCCAIVLFVAMGAFPAASADSTNSPAGQGKSIEQAILSWSERISVGGELRLRHQAQTEEGLPQRTRERFRARLNIEGKVNDNVKAGLRLVTNVGGDPISDNQTMTGSWSDKSFAVDRAFLKVTPVDGVALIGGKVAQPWYSVGDLVFSEDVNPEGFAVNCTFGSGAVEMFVHGGYWVLEERRTDGDSTMLSGQVGLNLKPCSAFRATVGASVYSYGAVQGRLLFFNATDAGGNSVVTNAVSDTVTELRYAEGYNEIEGFFRGDMDLAIPVMIGGQYVENTKVDDGNRGYMGTIALGKLKQPGSIEVGYQYRYLESDAILGVSAETGETGRGTGVKAHVPYLKYRLWKDFDVKVLYSDATKGLDNGVDFSVFRVDVSVKF